MKKVLTTIFLVLAVLLLFLKEQGINRPPFPVREGCMFCHAKTGDPDPSHPISAFGCYTCHLGNRYSLDRERAHFTMVRNPGDLRVVDRTCGKSGCHPSIAAGVKNSLMATNAGILRTLRAVWPGAGGEARSGMNMGVRELYGREAGRSLAIDYYRKMCGGCHLWKERGDREGEVGRRGGGCSDCHLMDDRTGNREGKDRDDHPEITIRIPSSNCTKCHNRSARIGLSYFGRFESAGYGTPYEGSRLSGGRLSGNRFFLDLHADIHWSGARLECVDCHTATGVMGDGNRYEKMRSQTDITCGACHLPRFSEIADPDSPAARSATLNREVPYEKGAKVAFTGRGTPIYNLQKRGDGAIFYRKKDGHPFEMNTAWANSAHHRLKGHERLSCQACHSPWIPQCYGCHISYDPTKGQRDWISGKRSPGRWKETRSYMRFSNPALGVRDDGKIFPISPCQEFVSILDRSGKYLARESFREMTISSFDPHTTSAKSRKCRDCHGDPKALGLGEGILHWRDGKPVFRPTYDSAASGLGIRFPLDGFVTLEGEVLQSGLEKGVRPFNRDELTRILAVNPCLGCHDRYDDGIYGDFGESMKRFNRGAVPCLR